MAHFELWERETLNEFAREATRKLLENEAEIERLRTLLKEARGWLNSRSALAKDIDIALMVPNAQDQADAA